MRLEASRPDQTLRMTADRDICPYQGLEVFDEEHAQFFFGRERDVQRLVEKLKSDSFSCRAWRIWQRQVIACAGRIDSRA